MRNYYLKKQLSRQQIPKYDEKALDKLIVAAKEVKMHPKKQRMSESEQFWNQVTFIPKKVWLLKILLTGMVFAGLLVSEIEPEQEIWPVLSVFGPLLCLVSANELCDICHPAMRELQLSVKYSLKKVMLVRLTVFGMLDFLILLTGTGAANYVLAGMAWKILLHTIVPYLIMCAGCMSILNRLQEEYATWMCTVWGGMIVVGSLVIKITDMGLLQMKGEMILGIAGIISIWIMIKEIRQFIQNGGGLDAVKSGMSV